MMLARRRGTVPSIPTTRATGRQVLITLVVACMLGAGAGVVADFTSHPAQQAQKGAPQPA